jgi:hypothetical protein
MAEYVYTPGDLSIGNMKYMADGSVTTSGAIYRVINGIYTKVNFSPVEVGASAEAFYLDLRLGRASFVNAGTC